MQEAVTLVDDRSLPLFLEEQKKPILLAFFAPWSQPCQNLDSILKELSSDYKNQLRIALLNIDENAHAPAEFGIRNIPHLCLIEHSEVIAELEGPQPKMKVVEMLDRFVTRA